MMPKRLATKLILSLTVIIVVVEGVSSYVRVREQERQVLQAMILGADQLSNSITGATWQAMLADNREAAYEVMKRIAEKQGIERIRIFNKEGRVMFSTTPNDEKSVDKRAEACALCHASLEPLVRVDAPNRARIVKSASGDRKLAMITPIYNEPACSQAECHAHPEPQTVLGVLDVSLDLRPVDAEIMALERQAVEVTVLSIVLIGALIFIFTSRFVSRPIRRLIAGTRAVAAMQLDTPIVIDTSQELGELSHSFNVMRERLMSAMNDLNKLTADLETKVEQRTQQLKAAHQKLLQTDRLASLGQLSASVAHEINNPLSGVLNLSMLMQRILKDDGIPHERIPEYRKYLSQVVNETSRVGRIVSDLLAFSRRSKPQTTMADLNSIIRTTVSLVSHKLSLSNVVVNESLQEDLPPLRCDSSQIQQVVMNLVMNAAEATSVKEGGCVKVRTGASEDRSSIVMEVQDDGEGIPPENLEKIFDPFFTTKGEGKGVGLGLAVVYGVINAHGGDIEVESIVGKGTTFKVILPLGGKSDPATSAPILETGLLV
ncbi:MAG TPA: ATP-binding protein [Bacteroidota bacterium]|nr:ATP-binding protein [Bacteroidota bacterium]